MKNLNEIIVQFAIDGRVAGVTSIDTGHINSTYKVSTVGNAPNYLLQKINHAIFQDVEMLQNNIFAVTNHIREKLVQKGVERIEKRVLTIIPTKNGKLYYFDGEGYWRMMLFIEGAYCYDVVNEKYSRFAGETFGDFQYMLSDLKESLGETIPNFHNIEFRLQQLNDAIEEDKVGRKKEVEWYIEEISKRSEFMCKGERLFREGKLPKRICHCDTKVNNMLFDNNGEVLCVIDLDTVMPSFIFSDFGDFLRSAANTAAEDEKELSKVDFNMDIYKAFSEGYIKSAGKFLLPIEVENLPYATALFPYMQSVRFLSDYLNGDTYYKTSYPEHNLVRTKAQFRLLESIEKKLL
jgi:Ser/Thr protein kinase RdoA (MazF antagonist)